MVDAADELQPEWFEGKAPGRPHRPARRRPRCSVHAGDRPHQGAGRGVGAQDGRHRGNPEVPAAQGPEARRHARTGGISRERRQLSIDWRARHRAPPRARIQARPPHFLRETPLWKLPGRRSAWRCRASKIWLKLEHLQASGSFKARGMMNRLLANDIPASGVIVASGGNAGIATGRRGAGAGRALRGLPARRVARSQAREAARAGGRGGGRRRGCMPMRWPPASSASAKPAPCCTHAYDQPEVVAGAGTLGREIEQQGGLPDSVLVSVGGGGLIGGLAGLVRDSAAAWWRSNPSARRRLVARREAGEPVDVEVGGIAADSLGARRIGGHRLGHHAAPCARRAAAVRRGRSARPSAGSGRS